MDSSSTAKSYDAYLDGTYLSQISLIQATNYGVINTPTVEYESQRYKTTTGTANNQSKILNVLNIQGTYFYLLFDNVEKILEYNPDLNLLNDKRNRWSYPEIEHKINIHDNQEEFWEMFDTLDIPFFPRGESTLQTSYESYILLKYGQDFSKTSYIDILSRKEDEAPNAIKYKIQMAGEILTRHTTIIDYSVENLNNSIKHLTGDYPQSRKIKTKALLPFSKQKKRFVCINNSEGFLFGVSCSIADSIEPRYSSLCQIEIEYWSKLIRESAILDEINIKNRRLVIHKELIDIVRSILVKAKIKFDEKQLSKFDWISQLSNNHAE